MKRKYLVDKRLSIILFAVVFLSYSLVYMTKNCYSAAMAAIVAEGVMTKSQTGLINVAFYLVYAPFQIIGGLAADKYPPHKLIAIGTLGAGVANLLIYFTQSYVAMIIIWSLNAVVQFGIWPSIFKIVSTELAPSHSITAIFYICLSSMFGLLFSYILAVFISDWRNNFLVSSIVLFCVTVILYFTYTGIKKRMITEDIAPQKAPKLKEQGTEKGEFMGILTKSGVPIIFAAYVIQSMLSNGIKAVAPVMLMESYESVSPALANGLNIILVLAGALGVFVAGISVFRRVSPLTVIFGFAVLCLPLLFFVNGVGKINIAGAVTSMAVIMLFLSTSSSYISQISKTFGPYGCVGTISGLFNCMASLGIVLSNFLFTKFSENYGWDFTTRFWIYIALAETVLCLVANPIWKKFVKKIK